MPKKKTKKAGTKKPKETPKQAVPASLAETEAHAAVPSAEPVAHTRPLHEPTNAQWLSEDIPTTTADDVRSSVDAKPVPKAVAFSSPAEKLAARPAPIQAFGGADAPSPPHAPEAAPPDADECEVMALDLTEPAAVPMAAPAPWHAAAVGLEGSRRIKKLLFGDRPWRHTWAVQGLCFSEDVSYGLVQHEGGPCGPLAVLQAFVLMDLFYAAPAAAAPDVSEERATQAVAAAMADILLNIAEQTHGHRATVFLATLGGGGAPPDGTNLKQSCHTEEFRLLAFTARQALVGYVLAHRAQYTAPRGNGLLLFLVSALYTKAGSAKAPDWGLLQRDMDCKDTSLVVEHGYCGQELVNLLLFGRAVSNVFDGVTEIGEGPDVMALQGVPHRSRAGYLTLMEHFGNCRVGERLKAPEHPVWVVCSESHYTVLFAKREGAAGADEAFDLWYWDQLGMQDEEIRLSVDPTGALSPSVPAGDELVPPIDDVIRTKWPGATINWNGTDPLL